jgi:hypothetical protein
MDCADCFIRPKDAAVFPALLADGDWLMGRPVMVVSSGPG